MKKEKRKKETSYLQRKKRLQNMKNGNLNEKRKKEKKKLRTYKEKNGCKI